MTIPFLLSIILLAGVSDPGPASDEATVLFTEQGAGVGGTHKEPGSKQEGHTRGRSRRAPLPTSGVVERRSTPTCTGNGPISGGDALCSFAIDACADVNDGASYLAWRWERVIDPPGTSPYWRVVDTSCVLPSEAADNGTPAVTVSEFKRLPLPAGKLNVEPGEGPVLINIPTNFYVGAQPLRLHTTVVGIDVEVEATPSSFTWTFGDGGRLVTKDHGAPYPDMRTTHVYTQPGKWPVTLTTTYTGRFRRADVPGSPWIPVAGTAQVTSPTVTLDVIEARAVLVP